MNNYSNMNYFMPNDFSYINMPIPNINNQNNLTNNLPVDKKLIEKLKKIVKKVKEELPKERMRKKVYNLPYEAYRHKGLRTYHNLPKKRG